QPCADADLHRPAILGAERSEPIAECLLKFGKCFPRDAFVVAVHGIASEIGAAALPTWCERFGVVAPERIVLGSDLDLYIVILGQAEMFTYHVDDVRFDGIGACGRDLREQQDCGIHSHDRYSFSSGPLLLWMSPAVPSHMRRSSHVGAW